MASFWFWLIALVGSIIGGAIFLLLIYGFFTGVRDSLSLKRGIPKQRTRVSEYIKEHPEKFENTNPGKHDKITKSKEVKNHGTTNPDTFRQFEKLRRIELERRIKGTNGNKGTPRDPPRDEQLPTKPVLPLESDKQPKYYKRQVEPVRQLKPSVKLDG